MFRFQDNDTVRTCATGAVRIHYAHRVYYYVKTNSPTYDITWEALEAWVDTTVEANLAIICASAPALKAYCSCLNNTREQRSSNWYHDHTPSDGPGGLLSRASERLFSWFTCSAAEDGRDRRSGTEDSRVDFGLKYGGVTLALPSSRQKFSGSDLDKRMKDESRISELRSLQRQRMDSVATMLS
ncbi:hypothetical protein BDV96DRAFT_275928 [Lophiotrema nucula]|uniref:Rhodopsin domain-containing protein n=1 Tax=Lophiotrema nucula TaxID=690887 RepID=A0A6A5ZNL1_9PLEO|nr:hypothetical protein BDV96DRAFT_275928 [Lophiotrema nucula]